MRVPTSLRRASLLLALVGCDRVFGLEPIDVRGDVPSSDTADGGDAGPCFLPRQLVLGVTGFDPMLTHDKRTLLYARNAGTYDLFQATRADLVPTTAFKNETAFAELNTQADETDPSLTEDGLLIMFTSNRSGAWRAYQAQRTTMTGTFTAPVLVPGLTTTTISGLDISPDGLTLYFDDTVSFAIAQRGSRDDAFADLIRPSLDHAEYPSVTANGLELYYNAAGIVRRTRAGKTDPFDGGTARVVDEGGSDADITPDGNTLVFRGGTSLYTRERCL